MSAEQGMQGVDWVSAQTHALWRPLPAQNFVYTCGCCLGAMDCLPL